MTKQETKKIKVLRKEIETNKLNSWDIHGILKIFLEKELSIKHTNFVSFQLEKIERYLSAVNALESELELLENEE